MAGGRTGIHLTALLDKRRMEHKVIPIQEWTSQNLAVTDTSNNQQYRFKMPCPNVYEDE